MKQKLPAYVVEALLVSGFDDKVSILGMDLDDGPNNSIKEIEKYIDERKANYPQCLNPNLPSNASFEFPPGHRIRIQAFITEVKSKHSTVKFASESKGKSRKRKLGVGVVDCDDDHQESVPNVMSELRKKLSKWSQDKLDKPLVENEDYSLIVHRDAMKPKEISASVRCIRCGSSQRINRKPSGNKPWQLSNFTKHYNSCVKGKRSENKQKKLQKYFPATVSKDFAIPNQGYPNYPPPYPLPVFQSFQSPHCFSASSEHSQSLPVMAFNNPSVDGQSSESWDNNIHVDEPKTHDISKDHDTSCEDGSPQSSESPANQGFR